MLIGKKEWGILGEEFKELKEFKDVERNNQNIGGIIAN